jgi:hypothetical protein
MWKILVASSMAVMAACTGVLAILSWHAGRGFEWRPILAFSAIGTAVFAIRTFQSLHKHRAIQLHRLQVERDALQELVDDMARLSPGDLSIYFTLLQHPEAGAACVGTSGGSPNHGVLVQMTDLGLAAPDRMENMGGPAHSFVFASYRLTERGRASLSSLLQAVAKRRRWFARHDG